MKNKKVQITESNQLIFIIDDAEWHNLLLKRVLEKRGFKVAAFQQAEELLLRLKQDQPDMIISDIDMPDIDGFQLNEKVRNISSCREVPLVFLSSSNSGEVRKKAREVGAYAHILKPLDKDELFDLIEICHSQIKEDSKSLQVEKAVG